MFPQYQYPYSGFPQFPSQQVQSEINNKKQCEILFKILPPTRFERIWSFAGLPVLLLPLRVSPAEEPSDAAAQQRPAGPGEEHAEATAPPAG